MTNSWVSTPINKFCRIVSGSTPKTSEPSYWGGDISWVTPMDLSKLNNKYISNGARNITESGLKSCSAEMIPTNSLVMSSRAPIGYFAINKSPVTTNQGCKSFVCNESVDIEFLYYALNQHIDAIKRLGSGSTFAEVGKKQLESLSIKLPAKNVQQKIGDILSSIDEAIQKNEQILQKKQELKRALLYQVTDCTTGDSISLGDVIKIKNGFAYSGKYMVDEETDTILLTPGNVEIGGGFNFSKLRYFSGEVIRDYELKHGDIFVALTDLTPKANFLGYPAIVPDLNKTFLHNQRLGLVQATSDKVDIKYVYFLLMTFAYRQHVISTATGTTVKHTSVSKIIDFKFKLPTLDEQKRIVQRIEKIELDLNLEKKSKDLYLKLKSGLMHDIFNQKVVIN